MEKLNIVISEEEKVLGIWWNLKSDYLFLKAKVEFTKVRYGKTTGTTYSTIDDTFPQYLTRRMVLSQVAKLFDPLGFPCTIPSESQTSNERVV